MPTLEDIIGVPEERRRSPIITPDWHLGRSPANAGRTFPPEILEPPEIFALIQACPRRGPSGLRNRALIVVLWRGGLRVGEAIALYPKDVDHVHGTITVLHGKGNKRRTVGIDPAALAVVRIWLEARAKLGISTRRPLFCTISKDCRGRPLQGAYVRGMLKQLGRRAGIEKRVHPHGLRHTHAYELAMEGTPLNLIQAQLGHSSLSTTDRYVRHIAPVLLVETMQARTWPTAA